MPVDSMLERALQRHYARVQTKAASDAAKIKHGAEIFAGTDSPREWSDFVGQRDAVEHLKAHLQSVDDRSAVRLDHILLASGLHGIGKTTLAMLVASKARTLTSMHNSSPGFVAHSGPLSVDEARDLIGSMDDGDILFWDEIHQAVAGNRGRADWMLPFLIDHTLPSASGQQEMPDITVIGATTDLGKLPQTIISRFMVRPKLVPYTVLESIELVANLARRMRVDVNEEDLAPIAEAANRNPRDMRMILTAVRDLPLSDGPTDLDKALDWAGFTRDGLTTVATDMLLVLLAAKDHTASIDTIQAQLCEPGTLRHHEQALLQRGYVQITGRGRVLTDEGIERAITAVRERA